MSDQFTNNYDGNTETNSATSCENAESQRTHKTYTTIFVGFVKALTELLCGETISY
jgi:hypothetical protein